ncbi:unnamed protein product [Polarella glacialis]|uniref:Uncharacterized protein n=1 Tax=Polarella glacialis TaxID=89957 RepID=A0A813FXZ9_POLGL|nr:unnamed protein product [Polarella glacialis]
MVLSSVAHSAEIRHAGSIGRAAWASGPQWGIGLRAVVPILEQLAFDIRPFLRCSALKPKAHGGSAQRKTQRIILDAAAWSREVIYVIIGHTMGATSAARNPRLSQSKVVELRPSAYGTFAGFQDAVHARTEHEQRQAVDT